MAQQCPDYRIGSTAAMLQDVTWYGIPYPIANRFLPYRVVRKCGNLSEKGYGLPSDVWTWNSLNQGHIDTLLQFFTNTTDASVPIYIRTYKDTGGMRETADYVGLMFRPIEGNGKDLVAGSRFNYVNISVRFEHLVEL